VKRRHGLKLPRERRALPDDLFSAIVETLPAREDRDHDAPLFPVLDEAALRTSITRACKATGTPHFSPHGLRRRRGSLLLQAHRLTRRGRRATRRLEAVAADHYVYALTDYREVDRSIALARVSKIVDIANERQARVR
jgi:integrase